MGSTLPRLIFVAAALAVAGLGCGGATPSSETPVVAAPASAIAGDGAHAHAASIWHERCGACHVPVEPGSRKHGYVETALKRHRKRVRGLSEQDWIELADFLGAPDTIEGAKASTVSNAR